MASRNIGALRPSDGVIAGGQSGGTDEPWRAWYTALCLAPDVAGLVEGAGGWIFDRASAGWDVSAVLHDWSDPRALQILGVQSVRHAEAWTAVQMTMPASILVAGHLYSQEVQIQRLVHDASDAGADVTVFGRPCSLDSVAGIEAVTYRLTAAARAFKAHAVTAAGETQPRTDGAESFRRRVRDARAMHFPRRRCSPRTVVPLPTGTGLDGRMKGTAR